MVDKLGPGKPDEAARRAAEEAARRRAAEAARQAPPRSPIPPRPAVAADAQGLGASTALEAQGGPRGEVAMPTGGPAGAAADDFDGFEGFGAPAGATAAPAAAPAAAPSPQTAAAMAFVEGALAQLDGPPAQAAQAIAGLLGDPRKFADAAKALAALKGTPAGDRAKAMLDQIAQRATPAALASKLGQVDPKALPREALTDLARLRAVADPALQAALDGVAMKLLPGLTPDQLKADEALATLVAPLGQSADPAARGAIEKAVKGWTEAAFAKAMAGKEGPEGVEKGLKAFQDEVVAIAKATGLGAQLEGAANAVMKAKEGAIEEAVDKGKSLWDRITGGISGMIDGIAGGLGKALKFVTDGVGKVANFAIDVTGKVATAGLDLTAAALDAFGADGAAKAVREADALVEGAIDAVGDQVQLFAEGVGSAFRDTVVGIGSTIAHPIETVKGIAHLVTHPGEIPKVAKALWDTATEKGAAYAVGYVAGNLLPMVLSGGSSSGGTLGARLGAIAGESRLLGAAGKALSTAGEAAAATRVGQVAVKGYQAVARVGGKVRTFTSIPKNFVGKLAAESQVVQKAAGYVRTAATAIGESGPGRVAKRLAAAYEDKVVALNDLIDGGLRKTLGAADHAVYGAEQAAASGARKGVADAARVQRGARELTEADRKLLEDHGKTLDEVEEMNRAGLGKNKDPNQDNLIKANTPEADRALKDLEDKAIARNRKVYDQDPTANLEKIGANRVEDGVIYQGARPNGEMPNVRVNYRNPKLQAAMDEAAKIAADATLSAEQKIKKVTDLIRGKDGQPGLLQAASTNDATNAWFDAFNGKMKGADFRLVELDDYLKAGIGDCRHFAITNQTLLQELEKAIPGLNPRVVYTATFETVENGKALAVNHAFNVVTIGGEDLVVDSILPHMTGGKVKDYVEKGIFGREVRFVNDRFQTQAGRWIKGGENVGTAFNTAAAPAVLAGQVQNAWGEER